MEEICTVEFLAVSLVHGDDALIAIEYLNLYMVICKIDAFLIFYICINYNHYSLFIVKLQHKRMLLALCLYV